MDFDWGSLVSAGIGLLGSNQQSNAAESSAQSNVEAAKIAAEAAAFRPVGLTTRFGKSGFNYDAQGNLQGAGYQVAPDLAAMREGLMGMAGSGLTQAQQATQFQPTVNAAGQNLFNMGSALMPQNMDINAAAQKYTQQQQGLLAPGREQQLAGIRNNLFQQGRGGLAVGGTVAGNMQATNPEMAAYYNSLAQQDAQLAAGANTQARNERDSDIRLGSGLFGAGLNTMGSGYDLQNAALKPFQQYLSQAGTIEGMGQGALDQATALGAKSSTAGANQAQYLSRTGMPYQGSALGSTLMGLANNQQFTSGLGGAISGLWSNPNTATQYGTKLGSQQNNMLAAQDSWFY